jgi:hypothetical protein
VPDEFRGFSSLAIFRETVYVDISQPDHQAASRYERGADRGRERR